MRRKALQRVQHLVLTSTVAASRNASDLASASARSAFGYCAGQVRENDHENYIWTMLLPRDLRPALIALRAFNAETAVLLDHVKEAALAQIRFQWWRGAVNSIFAGGLPEQHPVIIALSQVVGGMPTAKYRLQRIVGTREADALEGQPPPTLQGLEDYAEGTATQLLALQMEAAGIRNSDVDHAVSHLGKAVGIASLLRGTAHHAARRRSYLPVDLMAREGVSQEALYRGEAPPEALSNIVYGIASVAKGHLDESRALQKKLPTEARQLLLPAVACDMYLSALEKQQFDVMAPALVQGALSPLAYLFRVKYHQLRRTY